MPSFIILAAMAAAVAISTYPYAGMAKRGGGKQPASAAKKAKGAVKRGGVTKKAKPSGGHAAVEMYVIREIHDWKRVAPKHKKGAAFGPFNITDYTEHYLVSWGGFADKYNSWEPKENVNDAGMSFPNSFASLNLPAISGKAGRGCEIDHAVERGGKALRSQACGECGDAGV